MLDFHIFSVKEGGEEGAAAKEEKKPVSDMVIDSLIVAGIVFFSTWNGTTDVGNILNALKGFALAFLTQIAYYRGIKRQ
ncbi:MAG: hypothetical protein QXQ64_06260 [Candidatus Bathyarchaeia archaeon]